MKTLCLIISLTLSSICFAQTAVEKGQPSPDDGVFLTNEEAAKILAEKEACEKRCQVNIETEVEKQKTNCETEKNLLKNELDFQKNKFDEIIALRDKQEEELIRKIKEQNNGLYWFLGGAAVGIAVAAGTVLVVDFIQK